MYILSFSMFEVASILCNLAPASVVVCRTVELTRDGACMHWVTAVAIPNPSVHANGTADQINL